MEVQHIRVGCVVQQSLNGIAISARLLAVSLTDDRHTQHVEQQILQLQVTVGVECDGLNHFRIS